MHYPDARYLNTPVGEQLLQHYAARDRIRRTTALAPLRLADLVSFVRTLVGAGDSKGQPA